MANPFKELAEGIADLSQLQVQTYTGTINAHITDDGGGGSIINWKDLLTNSASESGDVSLVAATKVNIDGDTDLFIASNAPTNLVTAHNDAVAAAQQLRQGLLEAFADVLGIR